MVSTTPQTTPIPDPHPIDPLLQAPSGTLGELLAWHAGRNPDGIALRDGERTLTLAELHALCGRLRARLAGCGLAAGDLIAVCALNGIEYAALFVAATSSGIGVVPLPPSAEAATLEAMLTDSRPSLLFVDRAGSHAAGPAWPSVALEDGAPGQPWSDWLAGPLGEPAAGHPDEARIFNVIYSSGTTGTPKGIVHTHAMRWRQISTAAQWTYRPGCVVLVSTPLYSNTTLVSFLPAVASGGTVILMKKFDTQGFLDLSERHRVTHAMLVPVQYRRLMAEPGFDARDLSSYVMKFCTSAPFAPALKAEVLRRWPGGLTEFYGMTEGGGSCVLRAHEHPDKLHTVGQPMPGHDIRVIDPQTGAELPAGEVGEIVGTSMTIMRGYLNSPEKTEAALWISPEGERFVRTGDAGRFDADGFLTLMDRFKDMIISGGFNIYPSDIEAVLATHPDVEECAVYGVPSDAWGESPAAVVVPRGGAAADPSTLLDWVNERVGKTQRLVALAALDSLPRNHLGKIDKRALRARHGTPA
ncbi:class I adenylate-forming enzyme family protein [Verticiella sediminum]|uniref:class I adenylate-forming enzyme family protein n=1 Tax=Verticiella sediminum TaxID=1247510 RepID=UPI001FE9DD06|nr:class I adenylate-forming enzyme family protein [Verticiella sediminum]